MRIAEYSPLVLAWWVTLSVIGVLNIAWLLRERARFGRLGAPPSPLAVRQLWLAGGYVVGCATRSWIPRADVQRICLVDSWISTVLVGRTIATIAELCFVAQWALLLHAVAEAHDARVPARLARLAVPMIAVAECFSWYAVITTNYLGNLVEESIWAATGVLLTLSLAILIPRVEGRLRRLVAGAFVFALGYSSFMTRVDVPMYLGRWRANEAAGRRYFDLLDGLHDLATRWVVTGRLEDWHDEMPWMGLYFSVAVWISLAMVRLSTRSDLLGFAAKSPARDLPRADA